MEKIIIDNIITTIDSLFRDADRMMNETLACTPDEYSLYIPQFIIAMMVTNMYEDTILRFAFKMYDTNEFNYRGVKVVAGYEMAAILSHEQYPINGKDWMFKKAEFNLTRTII